MRASLGYPDPFTINYVEIGNEDFLHNGIPTYIGMFPFPTPYFLSSPINQIRLPLQHVLQRHQSRLPKHENHLLNLDRLLQHSTARRRNPRPARLPLSNRYGRKILRIRQRTTHLPSSSR